MNEKPTVTLDIDGRIATVTIDRPDALNALSGEVLAGLREVFLRLRREVALDRENGVRGVILTGAGGRAFVAGADIRAMSTLSPDEGETIGRLGHDVAALIEGLPVPVIACVDGFALGGGCELALACDLILATTASRFGQPEVKLGLIPGFGGTVRLPRAVGLARAKELIYTGRTIDAAEAQRLGLVLDVVDSRDDLFDAARTLIEAIAANAASAVGIAKAVLVDSAGRPTDDAVERELAGFREAFTTDEMREGVAAFLEKRAPRF
ncbi:enoyl-CoA hydratase/isomerase family protein [Agromyces atrinae]|uniref:enoyl-CoA hydratase n=1 Tax=Agromyces atrinae TaxID=592376 RepID=A0A4Q2M9G4_9MICO|nr:enoyl-CoA hydratase-related protein [Agromyces atrinae]NYD65531.1 enoyl-CoA hydratase [Agromyces atrinae]RXZ85740.1 enoyl-CoA hydratase [Agromyces atrinae]